MRILVVDGANVVGCVPDGWWRDRAGAAARLHASLLRTPLPYDEVILVLEGRAKAGVPTGRTQSSPVVTVVHAPSEGDDELVARCRACVERGDEVRLATADAGLLRRVESCVAGAVGPRELRSNLDEGRQ